MSDETPRIPKHQRAGKLPPSESDVRNLADLEQALLEYQKFAGAVPFKLTDFSRRFSRAARRLGTSVKDVLERMTAEGSLAVYYFSELRSTYVFSLEDWTLMMASMQKGIDPFREFVHQIKPSAARHRTEVQQDEQVSSLPKDYSKPQF